jgi:hypothetical protein
VQVEAEVVQVMLFVVSAHTEKRQLGGGQERSTPATRVLDSELQLPVQRERWIQSFKD